MSANVTATPAPVTATLSPSEGAYSEGDVVFAVRGRPHSKWAYYAVAKYEARRRKSDGKLTWRCVASYDNVRGRSFASAESNFLAFYGERFGSPAVHWDIRHGTPAV
jgi:hypothetical protein